MGLNHTAVIVEPGHVYTFGRNIEGQLGIGNTKPQNNIMEVKSMPDGSTVNVSIHQWHNKQTYTEQNLSVLIKLFPCSADLNIFPVQQS